MTMTRRAEEINKKKNYTFVKKRMEYFETDYGSDVNKCYNCAGRMDKPNNGSCHFGCSEGGDIRCCKVMNNDGYCGVCGCPWNAHVKSRSHYVLREV